MAATPNPTILLVDDDTKLCALLSEYFARFGLHTVPVGHPEAALRSLRQSPADLVILDIMLPEMDGLALLRKLRETSQVPVIMLTARGDVTDRVVGLELGADDYLPKPFDPRELVARVQAVLRRRAGLADDEVLRIGTLEISWSRRSVRRAGVPLVLTAAEFELLGLLVRNRGRVLSRSRILDDTRGLDWEAYDRSVDVLISRLRQKLGDDPKQPGYIRTVRGTGYSFLGEDGV